MAAPGGATARRIADRRFAAPDWSANAASAYAAQMYLLNARTLMQMADSLEGDAKTKARVRFAVQQWIDAAAPSNYLALNPEAQRKAIETQGESLGAGLAAPAARHAAGPRLADRRERCSRSAATSRPPRARWCSRTSCSS